MDEYVGLLILAYLKCFGQDYSLADLQRKIGVSLWQLDDYLDELFDDGLIDVGDNRLLSLSLKGRIKLEQSGMIHYEFQVPRDIESKKWPIDRVYPIEGFSKNRWRGGNK